MPFLPLAAKIMLDFLGGAAAAPPPFERWIGLLDSDGNEIDGNTVTGYARASAVFSPAASAGGFMSMAPTTIAPNGTLSIFAVGIYDAPTGPNLLVTGALSTPIIVPPNSGVVVGALSITLA